MKLKPTHIVIHCSATKDSGTVSWGAIRKYHLSKGWDDIGYHYGIELVKDQYEILLGRLSNITGAHCKAAGMNKKAIGICCVGEYDNSTPPQMMVNKCINLVQHLMELHRIPKENVIGHYEVEPHKTCPGTRFNMEAFRAAL